MQAVSESLHQIQLLALPLPTPQLHPPWAFSCMAGMEPVLELSLLESGFAGILHFSVAMKRDFEKPHCRAELLPF